MRYSILILPALSACHAHHSGAISPTIVSAEKAALTAPSESGVWADLGEAYLSTNQFDAAHAAFSEALRLDEDDAVAAGGLLKLEQSNWVSDIERRALENPADDEIWGDIGDYFAEKGLGDKALTYYLHAMTLDPADSEWQQKVSESGSIERVIEIFESNAVHNQDNDEWLGDYGDLLARMERREDACAQYQNALALDPSDSEWVQRVGECDSGAPLGVGVEGEHGMEGYHDEEMGMDVMSHGDSPENQIAHYEALIAQDPANDEYLGGMAQIMAQQGNLEQAVEYLSRALELDPVDSAWPGMFCALTGRSRVDVLTGLLDAHDGNDELHGDLGDAFVDIGQTDDAIVHYRRAMELDPEDQEWATKLALLGE